MGLFEHFPYSNFHDLNLNWIIGKIKNIEQITADVEEQSAAAVQSAADAAESAEQAAGSAEAAAGSAQEAAETVEPFTSTVTEIRARMNAFVQQHSGPADETVLYSSDTPVFSGNIEPSESISDYQNIKFIWRHRNDICEQEFKLTGSEGQNFYLRDCLGAYGAGNTATWEMCQIAMVLQSTGELQFTEATVIDNLQYNDGPVDNTMNTGILQVIGIRNVADTEVVDARVSSDGVTYQTLEERLNAEFSYLRGQIANGMPYEVKQAIDTLAQNAAYKNGLGYTSEIAVIHNWAVNVELLSISAVYSGGSVYETTPLDDLRTDLTVTALFDNGTTAPVTGYELSGELDVGTSTITVSYSGKTTTFNVTVLPQSREMLFGVFSDGYAISKQTGGTYPEYQPFAYRSAVVARATTPTPFTNNNYIFTVTDSAKYNIAVYDVDDMTELSIPNITQAVDHVGYHCGSKSISWAAQDSAATPYAWIALKKMDGTSFTSEELANGAEAVFTYITGE